MLPSPSSQSWGAGARLARSDLSPKGRAAGSFHSPSAAGSGRPALAAFLPLLLDLVSSSQEEASGRDTRPCAATLLLLLLGHLGASLFSRLLPRWLCSGLYDLSRQSTPGTLGGPGMQRRGDGARGAALWSGGQRQALDIGDTRLQPPRISARRREAAGPWPWPWRGLSRGGGRRGDHGTWWGGGSRCPEAKRKEFREGGEQGSAAGGAQAGTGWPRGSWVRRSGCPLFPGAGKHISQSWWLKVVEINAIKVQEAGSREPRCREAEPARCWGSPALPVPTSGGWGSLGDPWPADAAPWSLVPSSPGFCPRLCVSSFSYDDAVAGPWACLQPHLQRTFPGEVTWTGVAVRTWTCLCSGP